MPAVSLFDAWSIRTAQTMRGQSPAPDDASFYAILINGVNITRTSTLSAIVAGELSTGGYARQQVNFSTAGDITFNNTTKRADIPSVDVGFSATSNITFDAVVLIADGNSTPGNSTGDPVWFLPVSPTVIAANTTQPLTISGWGFADLGSNNGV